MQVTFNNIKIAAMTSVVPKDIASLDEYSDVFGAKKVKRIKKSTGVDHVHVVVPGQTASDLCQVAAEKLFIEASIDKTTIDAIIFASITPDHKAPATSIILQDKLGLSKDIVAMDTTFGCSGFMYGLYMACMMISSGGCRRVLLCTGDTQSTVVNPKDRAMKMLVGDAGAATIIECGEHSFSFVMGCDGSGYKDLIIPAGGSRIPSCNATRVEYTDDDGNTRSQEDLYMNGMSIMKFALSAVPDALGRLFDYADIKKENVALFVMHQPNKMILQSLCLAMDISEAKMPCGMQEVGNTASASIPTLLSTLKRDGYDFAATSDIVACGFGIGLSYAAANVILNDTCILPVSVLN